jgi:hypothetical protein
VAGPADPNGRSPPSTYKGASGPAVTERLGRETDSSLSWDDAWPRVTDKVGRILRSRGAPSATIDDAIQTAALRALCRSEGFDSHEGMVAWVTVVAWHEVQNEWRRQTRIEPGDVPDRPAGPDPAAVVEGRLELKRVVDSLMDLSVTERQAILAVPQPNTDNAERARVKMRRYRARKHLAALAGLSGEETSGEDAGSR